MNWDEYWKSISIKNKLIDFARKHYYAKIFASVIRKVCPKGKILEAGCGSGMILKELRNDYICYGCDNSEQSLKVARENCDDLKLCDIRKLPYEDKEFELVFNQGVMEHFSEREFVKILKEMKRVGKKVLIIVPSNYSIFKLFNVFDKNQRFINKKWLENILRKQLRNVRVKYLSQTFFFSIAGWGDS
jgi:ubiquinone/menaquinone biosynthesis C-methylase UbiE